MLSTIKALVTDGWKWRRQLLALAKLTLRRDTHGSALGVFWLFLRPAVYIFCFWFAISVGLRGGHGGLSGVAYVVWLSAGVVPWFYLQKVIQGGGRVFGNYAYLVNKLKFPVHLIPVFYSLGYLLLHFALLVILGVIYFIAGGHLDIHILQLPLCIILAFIFFIGFSLGASSLTAVSKDVSNLLSTISTPIFWLSGVIYSFADIGGIIEKIMYFNPFTFIITCYRQVIATGCDKVWMWDDPFFLIAGLVTVALTFFIGVLLFSRLRKEIADVI